MSYRTTLFILTLMLAALVALPVFATGNIGFNYSRAVDDQNWGFLGDYEHKADIFDFEVEGAVAKR